MHAPVNQRAFKRDLPKVTVRGNSLLVFSLGPAGSASSGPAPAPAQQSSPVPPPAQPIPEQHQ
jgi:hypothetical protein